MVQILLAYLTCLCDVLNCMCYLVPSSVLDVSYQNISSTSILVSWVPPLNPNGRITHYTVYGLKLHSNQALKWVTNSTSLLITGQVFIFATQLVLVEYRSIKYLCSNVQIWTSILATSYVQLHLQLWERALCLRKMTSLSSPQRMVRAYSYIIKRTQNS